MQGLQEILTIRNKLSVYLDFSIEETTASGKAGPRLRERLEGIPFTAAAVELLKDQASTTLLQDFKKAAPDSGAINSKAVAKNLTHAFCDPLRKSFFVMSMILGSNAGAKKAADFDSEEKEMLAVSGFSLLYSLRDIAANFDVLLPQEIALPDEFDLMRREIKNNIIPPLEKAAPAFAASLGFSPAAVTSFENKARTSLLEGREHLSPLPAPAWRDALKLQ